MSSGVFNLRLPEDLRNQLEAAKKASGRSLNAELVWRLSASFGLEQALERAERAERGEAFAWRQNAGLQELMLKFIAGDLRVVHKDQLDQLKPQDQQKPGEAA
jgi:hypothetical protein